MGKTNETASDMEQSLKKQGLLEKSLVSNLSQQYDAILSKAITKEPAQSDTTPIYTIAAKQQVIKFVVLFHCYCVLKLPNLLFIHFDTVY